MSDSFRPYGLQHAKPPCPSPIPADYSKSCPSSQWCHPAITPSPPAPFSFCPNPSQHQGLCQWVNSLHEVAKVVEFQLQHQSYWKNKHNLTQMASHFRQQAFSTKIKKKKLKLDKKVVHSFNYLLSPVFPVYNIRNFSFVELTMWSINGKLL